MNTTRRTFLTHAPHGGALLCSLPFLASCGGVTRSHNETEMIPDALMTLLGQERWEMLRLASLAPNGHNTQPWAITIVEPDQWILGSDPDRWLPAVDPENRELLLSLGAFLENLRIAARHFGYEMDIDVLAQSPHTQEIARLTLRKSAPIEISLDSLCTRRTLRSGLARQALNADDVNFITSHAPQRCHYFPIGSPQADFLAEGTLESNRLQAYREPAQEELADWIRWSNDDARQHRDGITPATMEIGGVAGWYVRTFYDREDVLSEGFRKATIKKTAEQIQENGGWIVVTAGTPDAAIPDLLETGSLFQQLCLKVRERMIAIHPMTQILEEGDILQVSAELGLTEPVQFVLRTGYVRSYPEPVSLRRPVAWFTQEASQA